jgi:hypothetical protein
MTKETTRRSTLYASSETSFPWGNLSSRCPQRTSSSDSLAFERWRTGILELVTKTLNRAPLFGGEHLGYSENTALDVCYFPFGFRQAPLSREAVTPLRRVNLDYSRLARWYRPAVKWPQMSYEARVP